jgi:Holliday junction resolvasome RuvABC endonuclease subunit
MMKVLVAIDPANKQTGYVLIDQTSYKPIAFGKVDNIYMKNILQEIHTLKAEVEVVIEMVANYGTVVGRDVFETCIFIGRLQEMCNQLQVEYSMLYRSKVKLNLCGKTATIKDPHIIQALKDRFGDKGTKANPGWFFGFKEDIWQAYALGVTFLDMKSRGGEV